MTKYVLAYHGGGMPETPEEGEALMAAWNAWFASMGDAVIDGGNPTGMIKMIASDGSVTDGGGAAPITGYSLLQADSLDAAVELAKGCPILNNNGSIQVAEAMEM